MEYGKWHVGQGNGEGSVFADDGRMRMENNGTTLYPICKVVDFNGEGKDHAHLIAAAPDLLEACKLVYENLKPAYPSDHLCMKKLQQALAKAEGKEV